MTKPAQVPIATIWRGERQRRTLPNIDILAESIKRLGLINPITLLELEGGEGHPRPYKLIAGERRLTACQSLGWASIPARIVRADEAKAHAIELEENIKREDITWQERVLAIQAYHNLRCEEPDWSQTATAKALGISTSEANDALQIAGFMHKEEIAKAEKFSIARGLVRRAEERRAAAAIPLPSITVSAPRLAPNSEPIEIPPPAPAPEAPILNEDFCKWAPQYSGPKFNLIHCDFPYGVNAHERDMGNLRHIVGAYEDSPETYRELLLCFVKNLNRFCERSAHLIFWFSMEYYHETFTTLQSQTPFEVQPFPLIWHKSDNAGILADPNRAPRRTYETAFLASRGDRKVVRSVAASYSGPTVKVAHLSEKPQMMLEHFFRMLVDEHSSVFDPTCGSGSALRAARSLKAERVLGLELNPEYAKIAAERFNAKDHLAELKL